MRALNEGSALIRSLVAGGALDPASVVDGVVVVHDRSSRNRNALVSAPGDRLFVKEDADAAGVAREAGWYRRLSAIAELAPYLPPVRAVDPAGGRLLLGAEAGGIDLEELHLRRGAPPARTAHELGRALGILHRATRVPSRPAPHLAPGALSIHRPRLAELAELTPASLEVIRALQGQAALHAALDGLRERWRVCAVTHNDIRPANLIVTRAEAPGRPSLRLVDWEDAGDGDPAWDVGSAFAACIAPRIAAAAGVAPGPQHGRRRRGRRRPPDAVAPVVGACWEGYLAGSGLQEAASADLLTRATALAGARLIQAVVEQTQASGAAPAHSALQLRVAASVLTDPALATDRLLGLRPAGGGREHR